MTGDLIIRKNGQYFSVEDFLFLEATHKFRQSFFVFIQRVVGTVPTGYILNLRVLFRIRKFLGLPDPYLLGGSGSGSGSGPSVLRHLNHMHPTVCGFFEELET